LKKFLLTTVFGLSTFALATSAFAQAEIEQVDERFEQRRPPLSEPGRILPAFDPLDAPLAAEAITLRLGGVRIIGNTVVGEEELGQFYEMLLDTEVPVTAIFALANRITAYYGQQGYPLSRAIVPAQEIGSDGIINIQIVEGFVDRVEIDDERARENAILREHGETLTRERPISNARLERELLLADDLPGMQVRSVLRRSDETQGATTVVLDTEEQRPVALSFTLDNRGSDAIGPFQMELSASFNNVLHLNSQTRLRFANASLNRELLFGELEHEAVLNAQGLRLLFGLRGSRAEPGTAAFQAIDLQSESFTGYAELRYPAIRSRNQNLYVYGRIEARDSETTALNTLLSRDRIRSLRLGADYDRVDDFGGLNTALLEISMGIPGLGANSNNDPLNSRADGRVDYFSGTLDLSRTQQLGYFSDDLAAWSVFGQFRGQFTGTSLLSSEECSLGGSELGRAFDPSTLAGDRCIAALVEARYQVQNSGFLDSLQLYAFADAGSVSDVGGAGSSQLSSAGLGARFGLAGNYRGSIEVNQQLRNTDGGVDTGSPRVFLSISGEF